jgi:uncharacterized delta-60 repeat protein
MNGCGCLSRRDVVFATNRFTVQSIRLGKRQACSGSLFAITNKEIIMTHKNAYKKLCSLFATLLFAFFLSATSYAAPGDLDPTFGTDGKVTTTFNFAVASDVALQADGKIVVAGSNFSSNGTQIVLARYHTNGSLDASFGNGGRVYTSVGNASAIAIQADGRIVVAGFVCVIGPTCDFTVVRFTTNGSLDTSFDYCRRRQRDCWK